MAKGALFVLCLSVVSSAPCPEPWTSHGNGCYYATSTRHTFTDCQKKVCEARGGSLAIVVNKDVNQFLSGFVTSGFTGRARVGASGSAFIGFWRTPEKRRDWHWIGNSTSSWMSNFTAWHDGQPDSKCDNEDCVAINLRYNVKSWFDISCSSRLFCICELGVSPSADFRSHEDRLASVNTGDYSQCPPVPGHECFWQGSVIYKIAYTVGVLPCLVVAAAVVLSMCLGTEQRPEIVTWPAPTDEDWSAASSSYGFLVGKSDSAMEAGEVVHRWIMRGALVTMLYALVPWAISTARLSGDKLGFPFDAAKASAMCICKLVVGISALAVHRNLSPVSKAISGNWILAIAWTKFIMALCALVVAVVYLLASMNTVGMTTLCVVRFILSWTLLTHLFLQSLAGFGFFRIQRCASACVGDPFVFSKIMRCWWSVLIVSTFGVGIGVWVRGLAFVFETDADILPYVTMQIAAFFEFLAGAAMLLANARIRAYFRNHTARDKPAPSGLDLAIGAPNGNGDCHDEDVGCQEL